MRFINKFTVSVLLVLITTSTAYAARCADYSNCRQAVKKWCAGQHARADGDGDGIPCENVCSSRSQVQKIMREIGCSR